MRQGRPETGSASGHDAENSGGYHVITLMAAIKSDVYPIKI
jgi:hypothetical protein